MASRTDPRLGLIPHFDVTTVDGRRVRYQEIWQRRNLVLVTASSRDRDAAARYASRLQARRQEFEQADASVVVTTDPVPGLAPPMVAIADRWGEILHVADPADVARFPDVDELLSWVQFVRMQCPECPP
jgi:hypothetical protein